MGVADRVHRVWEQLEDAIKRQVLVLAEKEIAPVPAIVANTPIVQRR